MAADFTISQAGGAGAGTLNTELLAVWGGLVLQLDAAAAAAYSWTILDKPHGAVATIVSPTAQNATLTPDDLPGRWRIQLTTPDGSRVLVFEVTKTVAGVVYNFGLGVTPAHLERPSEAGGRGAARVFERFRASLLALISALPLADKLLLRDTSGAAVASSFTGGSTLDTVITAVNTSPTERKILLGRASSTRLRFEGNDIYVDRWNGATHEVAGLITTVTGGLYVNDADGVCEFILGPDNVSLGAGAGTLSLLSSGLMTLTANGGLSVTVGGVTCQHTVSGGTFDIYANAPMRIRPAQATSGAGRDLTIGGGPGQTSGVHAPGKLVVDMGARVGNTGGVVEFRDTGTSLLEIQAGPSFANYSTIAHRRINSGLYVQAAETGGGVYIEGNGVVGLWSRYASNAYLDFGCTRVQNRDSALHVHDWIEYFRTALAASGAQNIATRDTTTNRVQDFMAWIRWSNDTDNTGGSAWVEFTLRNVAGTVTQIGATYVDPDRFRSDDTGVASAAAFSGDFSGITGRVRCNPSDADARNFNIKLYVGERALA